VSRPVGQAVRSVGVALAPAALVLAGCGGGEQEQSTLEPHSKASRQIAHLWWVMLTGATIVFAVVVMLILVAVVRRHGRRRADGDGRATTLVILGGAFAPLVVLPILFVLTIQALPATSAPGRGETRLTVNVTGKQWFWEASYEGTKAVTANEIHIPAGTSVALRVRTADVVHSFWVPELNRKIDMIPGRTNEIELRADEPGIYRGQCAEFCGLQHANMAFLVYADPPRRFRAWLAREARPARPPATASARAGEKVFLDAGCGGCHTIRGTAASGHLGPDLTHLASRSTIAANTIPLARGYLGGWILDPQHVKPGNRMPGFDLTGRQLQPLLDYLTGLK
jgi:cytochrome c oxidase subunit II